MRVAILGTGSLGGVIAGCLADAGADLVCVSRGRTAKVLKEGMVIFTPEGTVEMIPGESYVLIDSEKGPLDASIAKHVKLPSLLVKRTQHRHFLP